MTGRPGTRGALIAIVLAAALLRVVFSGWVVGFHAAPIGDETDYHAIASHLLAGDGFCEAGGAPTARRPPAYPVLLAGLYALTGPSPAAGRVVQVILGVLVVLLTAAVARRIFDTRVALAAAALAACNPFLAFISGYLLTENLYMVLVLAALWVAPSPRRYGTGPVAAAAASAALFALAVLARPTGLPLFEWTAAAVLVLAVVPLRARAVRLAAMVAVFIVLVLPWYARNARVVGGWVLTTHGGITFYQGNNPRIADVPQWRGGVAPLDALPRYDELAVMPEVERDRLAWQLGREFVTQHPSAMPRLVMWKLARFWRLKSDMGLSGIRSGWWWNKNSALGRLAANVDAGFVYAAAVMPLFVAGVWLTRRRWQDLMLLYGVVVVHTAVAAAFFGSLRGRIPIEPVICIFAGVTVAGLASALSRRRGASRVPADSGPAPPGT
ncbi:MAG TPA: glycosyltransferase family 39 protein [Candidatus Krumholzibacteria bacterium]|nr:glycosyltransferase family 39 protein [Candidatus Krumholzibacteria bacterium]